MATQRFEAMPRVLARRGREVEESAERLVKMAAAAWGETTVRGTPVDTGLHRSNWVASNDQPFGGLIPPYAPGKRLGIDEQANATAAIAQIKSAVASYSIKRNQRILITNNGPVIVSLNRGSVSRQSQNFVELGLQSAIAVVKGQKILRRP